VVVVFTIVAGSVAAAIPLLAAQVVRFIERVPRYIQIAQDHSSVIGRLNERFHLQQRITDTIHGLGGSAFTGFILKAGTALFSAVSNLVIGCDAGLSRLQRAGLGPIDRDLALADKPFAVLFDQRVQVANRYDHQGVGCFVDAEFMHQTVGYRGGPKAVECGGALTIDMHGRPVVFEFVAYRGQRRASPKSPGRLRISTVGKNDKLRVLGEQR